MKKTIEESNAEVDFVIQKAEQGEFVRSSDSPELRNKILILSLKRTNVGLY
jgi:hypothetical protein